MNFFDDILFHLRAALYGVVFTDDKEAAFSNYRLWQSIGSAVALAYANFLCVRTKLFVLMIRSDRLPRRRIPRAKKKIAQRFFQILNE